jgi:putative membrane protein insertion efficiency factor
MSSLRQRLKNPRTWLIIVGAILVLTVADSLRAPKDQLTAWIYVRSVRIYQWGGRPLLKGRVQCRFQPSCSDYSIEAVEIHGIRRGLVLTCKRLSSCTSEVPLGTPDPVPPVDE